MAINAGSPSLDLEEVFKSINEQLSRAEDKVKEKIGNVSGAGADDPAKLAELQQAINTWSVMYNVQSTMQRSIKDVMQNIMQKVS